MSGGARSSGGAPPPRGRPRPTLARLSASTQKAAQRLLRQILQHQQNPVAVVPGAVAVASGAAIGLLAHAAPAFALGLLLALAGWISLALAQLESRPATRRAWLVTCAALAAPLPGVLLVAAVAPVFFRIAAAIGDVSAWLSVPLLLAPGLAALHTGLSLSLAASPAAEGLPEPFAEARDITAERGGQVLKLFAPCLLPGLLAALALILPPRLCALAAFAAALPAALWQGAAIAETYPVWRAPLRPDMRPSRYRNRRREPIIGPAQENTGAPHGLPHAR